MTRFARAKGSKASNERREEDATPWNVMRKQLAGQLNSNESHASINNDACVELKHSYEKKESSNTEEIWCHFDESNQNKCLTLSNLQENGKKNKAHDSRNVCLKKTVNVTQHATNQLMSQISKKKSKYANKSKFVERSISCEKELHNTLNDSGCNYDNNALPKPKLLICTTEINKVRCEDINSDISSNSIKKNITKVCKTLSSIQSDDSKYIKKNKKTGNINSLNTYNYNDFRFKNNGVIQLVQYEGFLIKKDDAVRLKNLRKKLKSNKIEKEKINVIMKLERRKAEKALAREKRNVCFHCRKFGHFFKDCPEMNDNKMSQYGVCFKCGSTEHTYYQCNIMKNEDFRHAICFVCKEQGHIARQCSLNPQGQYPKGGCCHLCGEVTHLRKDCPKATNKKSDNSSKVETINRNDINLLSEVHLDKNKLHEIKRKVVTF